MILRARDFAFLGGESFWGMSKFSMGNVLIFSVLYDKIGENKYLCVSGVPWFWGKSLKRLGKVGVSMKKTLLHGMIFLVLLWVVLFVENVDLGITLHMMVYVLVAMVFLHSLLKPSVRTLRKAFFLLFYYSILSMQLYFLMFAHFEYRARLFVAVTLFVTFLGEQLWQRKEEYCVSPMEEGSLSFEDLRYLKKRLDYGKEQLKQMGGVVTLPFVREIAKDFPRNCSVRYMAKESLSETYFQHLEDSLEDEHVYLVFSDTGSAASNFIGLMTRKPYNHISFSFDDELKTLISYNGGERVSPPGLNPENLEWFYRKEDASIRIYRLAVSSQQKRDMAERIRVINREGSAYNLLGKALGKSIQPNMMVCSEFVYSLLESVGAEYFQKTALDVKPSDLIELDYERKLEFLESIQLSSFCEEMVVEGKPLPPGGKPYVMQEREKIS